MPLVALAAIGVAGGIATSAIGAHAAGKAANAQVNAANYAADLQHKDAQQALQFQQQQYADSQKNAAPYIAAGQGAVGTLAGLMGPGGELTQGFNEKFQAPTGATEQNDPGYQFRLQQGMKALQSSAAAKGGLLTGGFAKAATQYGQDYASNEYQNVYNRAQGEYTQRYNIFENNQNNLYNRYANLAGLGQTSVNNLNATGQAAANNTGNILMTSGQQIGQDYQNAGAARASGYVGAANAVNSGINGATNSIMQYLLYKQLNGGGGGSTGGFPTICWVAAELYDGWEDPRTHAVRSFLTTKFDKTSLGHEFVETYKRVGPKIATLIQAFPELRDFVKPIFDQFVAAEVA